MAKALDEYQTELMTTEAFEKYWPFISNELDTVPHIWNRYYTKDYIYAASMMGDFQVWGVGTKNQIRMVVFTKVLTYSSGRVFQVCMAFGNDVEQCLPNLVATLEKTANDAGCLRCEIVGREGWLKLLPGFKKTEVIMSKVLEPLRMQ